MGGAAATALCWPYFVVWLLHLWRAQGETPSGSGRIYEFGDDLEFQSEHNFILNRARVTRLNTLPPNGVTPIQVQVSLSVEGVRDIEVDALIDFYVTFIWRDDRERNMTLFISGRHTNTYCWIPDIYFISARKLEYFEKNQYLDIKQGRMLYDEKIGVAIPCVADAFWYPFDQVTCIIRLSSYGYDETQVKLLWHLDEPLSIPEIYYKLEYIGYYLGPDSVTTTKYSANYAGLNYTILGADVKFTRLYTVYIYQLFIPSAILVCISWTTFWINRSSTPARAVVGITTILTSLTLTTNRQQERDSKHINMKMSLIDIYMWICFLYVIAAFVLFTVSDFTLLREKKIRVRSKELPHECFDISCRVAFPASFLALNLVFWSVVYWKNVSYS